MLSNRKLSQLYQNYLSDSEKSTFFLLLLHNLVLLYQKYKAKLYLLRYYRSFKQMRASTNHNQSFV